MHGRPGTRSPHGVVVPHAALTAPMPRWSASGCPNPRPAYDSGAAHPSLIRPNRLEEESSMSSLRSSLRIATHAVLAVALIAGLEVLRPPAASAAGPSPGPPITIRRASGPITPDGDLSDAGWQGLAAVTTWFETRVGDNVEPQVKNEAYLAYDDRYLYAAFRFQDPDPASIRAPLGDHDALAGSTDYAGVIVDGRNDGRTAQMFLSNPRGLQYDALTSDVSGEDSAPDFFWDAAGKITETGWTLELRIPFSSLRYASDSDPTWGVLLYRNYPRDRRYQFFSARLPRDVNCFICNSSKLTGLQDLPRGSSLVLAPFATGQQTSAPRDGLGSGVLWNDFDSEYGADLKWSPSASTTLDATVNPDFSQVESDAAQIAANERFALFVPEKRPFFLEGVDLFSTPMQAVYTRTVTRPKGGMRVTGRSGNLSYTALGAKDLGGGVVILPGPQGSGFADQEFESDVGVLRVRRDLGRSFVSVLATAREMGGGHYNRVAGPDFQWRPRTTDTFTGQFLWSDSRTSERPDLAPEWDGRRLSDRAMQLSWSHSTPKVDWYLQGQELGEDFRADNGFIPQVGYREVYFETGYTLRPKDQFLSRLRLFTANWVDADFDGDVLSRRVSLGAGMDGRWSSFIRLELNRDDLRVGDALLQRIRPRAVIEMSPNRMFNSVTLTADVGDEIDFAHGREGSGVSLNGSALVRPGDRLELRANVGRRWLNVTDATGRQGRLFLAEVERLRATWSFSSRSFLRVIGQYQQTRRDLSLYPVPDAEKPPGKTADLSASALFAYKLNWQTVLYAGYGDGRSYLDATGNLEKSGQQAFAKVSYAWQQ